MQCSDLDQMTDLELIQCARRGDWDAFEKLTRLYQDRVFGLAYRITAQRQDAEDVTQQTFSSLLEHLETFREEASVSTWILRIARNHALKILRKKRGLPSVSLDAPEPESGSKLSETLANLRLGDSPEAMLERTEVMEGIREALFGLEHKYREVFMFRDMEGYSTKETAELLGLSEANVKVRLLRARTALRDKLTKWLGDEEAVPEEKMGHKLLEGESTKASR